MKKAIIVVVLFVMVLFCFSMVSAEGDTIKVVTDPVWPPFEYMNEETKEMIGFDIDLMNAIAKDQGLTVEFVNQAFDTAIASMASCQYDASISAITITEERGKQFLFSDPYFTSGQILTVKEGNEALSTKDAVKGKTLGGQNGTTGAMMAQEWASEGWCKVKIYDSVDLAFLDLKNGQIDATLTDDTVAYAYSEQLGGIIPVGELFSSEEYGIAICKSEKDLQTKINDGLAKVKEDGTWDEIYAKYFGSNAE